MKQTGWEEQLVEMPRNRAGRELRQKGEVRMVVYGSNKSLEGVEERQRKREALSDA